MVHLKKVMLIIPIKHYVLIIKKWSFKWEFQQLYFSDIIESSDEEEDSDFDSDLNVSESLTECEFTDSEGRPNPFHKHIEVPKIVIQAGSPGR